MSSENDKKQRAARVAVSAYNSLPENFDPYGSYTGRSENGKPCQDADDL